MFSLYIRSRWQTALFSKVQGYWQLPCHAMPYPNRQQHSAICPSVLYAHEQRRQLMAGGTQHRLSSVVLVHTLKALRWLTSPCWAAPASFPNHSFNKFPANKRVCVTCHLMVMWHVMFVSNMSITTCCKLALIINDPQPWSHCSLTVCAAWQHKLPYQMACRNLEWDSNESIISHKTDWLN